MMFEEDEKDLKEVKKEWENLKVLTEHQNVLLDIEECEDVLIIIEELEEARNLIEHLWKYLGTNADTDFRLWKKTEQYCKDKGLGKWR